MAATEWAFICDFGSSRARYSKLVSIPHENDIPDTPDLSILCFDVILDEKSNMAAHP